MVYETDSSKIKIVAGWLGTGSINIFGSPFAGKDTQGRQLAKLLNAQLIGGGDILRSDTMPDRIKELMRTGELIPQADYLKIVLPYFNQPVFRGKPLVLSSVGRWHGEEDSVLRALTDSGHPLRAVLFLGLSEDMVRQRWQNEQQLNSRGERRDDSAEALEIRLKEYNDKTLPVIDFYRQYGILSEIDGDGDSAEITSRIIDSLGRLATT